MEEIIDQQDQLNKINPAPKNESRIKSEIKRSQHFIAKKKLTEIAQHILREDLPYVTLPSFYEKIRGLKIDGKEPESVNIFTALFISVVVTGIKKGSLDVLEFVYRLISDAEEKQHSNKSIEFENLIVAIKGLRQYDV